jgi:hypothetical protein
MPFEVVIMPFEVAFPLRRETRDVKCLCDCLFFAVAVSDSVLSRDGFVRMRVSRLVFLLLLTPTRGINSGIGTKQGVRIALNDQAVESRWIAALEGRLEKKLSAKFDQFASRLEALSAKITTQTESGGAEVMGSAEKVEGDVDCSIVEEKVALSGKKPAQALALLRQHADCSRVHRITMKFETSVFTDAQSIGELVDIFLGDRFEWQVVNEPYQFEGQRMTASITLRKVRDETQLAMAAFIRKRQFPARCSDRKILAMKVVLVLWRTLLYG